MKGNIKTDSVMTGNVEAKEGTITGTVKGKE